MKKVIGVIGGLSAESTVSYYLHMSKRFNEIYGKSSCPEIIIYSVNLEDYHKWRDKDRWDLIINDLVKTAERLKIAGADFGLIATNTMHKVYSEVIERTNLPLINLLEAVKENIILKKISKVGLIGTKFTMNDGFYHKYLENAGLSVVTPTLEQQTFIHKKIETELVKGIISEDTKHKFLEIMTDLKKCGAQGVILGCTEIPLLINQNDFELPIFDTAIIHAEYTVNEYLKNRDHM